MRDEIFGGGVKSVHIVGIGGVSMNALAVILKSRGYTVSGSDSRPSEITRELERAGIKVYAGHAPSNLESEPDAVLRTAAAGDDNPEIAAARERGIPVFERAPVCGTLMRGYKSALCVAGTHGKTTTTGMCAQIALAAGLDPTVMLGGTLPSINACHRIGGDGLMVFEACEYKDSFLSFSPTVAAVLNVDADHLDYFSGLEQIKSSFRRFAELTPPDGAVVYNAEDLNAAECLAGINRRVLTFGLETGDITARFNPKTAKIDIKNLKKTYAEAVLKVPGEHNRRNAAAAAACAYALGIDGRYVAEGLNAFTGTERRFQYVGSRGGAEIYDDYAHHPAEIRAALAAAREFNLKRVIVAFQPHTYSRTEKLFAEFADALKAADKVFLAEIYAARETPTGMSSAKLAAEIPGAEFCPALSDVTEALARELRPGDLVITMGAGDVYKAGRALF